MGLSNSRLLKAGTANCSHLPEVAATLLQASLLAAGWLAHPWGEMAAPAFYVRPIWATQ